MIMDLPQFFNKEKNGLVQNFGIVVNIPTRTHVFKS